MRVPAVWPLVVVLAVQAVLSVRLVRADTAFEDEATYLWAGHLEWAHWLHGTSIPPFASYFSGAPVIYPPLGALADSAGGAGWGPDVVAGVHAGGDRVAVGDHRVGCLGGGLRFSPLRCSRLPGRRCI